MHHRRDDLGRGDAESDAQSGEPEHLREGAQHDEVLELLHEIHAAVGSREVDVGLVEHDELVLRRRADAADLLEGDQSTGRAVGIGEEDDPNVVLDGGEIVVPFEVEVIAHADEDRHAPLVLGRHVIDRERGHEHQHLVARRREHPNDPGDDLGLAGAADHLVGCVAVLGGDLLAQHACGPIRIDVELGGGTDGGSGLGRGPEGIFGGAELGDVIERDAVGLRDELLGQARNIGLLRSERWVAEVHPILP